MKKIISMLFIALGLFSLASCSSFKQQSNEVSYDEFFIKLNEVKNDMYLTYISNLDDFKMYINDDSNTVTTTIVDSIEIDKEIHNIRNIEEVAFDFENQMSSYNNSSNYDINSGTTQEDGSDKNSYLIQYDEDTCYYLYENMTCKNNYSDFETMYLEKTDEFTSIFDDMFLTLNQKYYIDDNTYTVIYEKLDEENYQTTSKYQLQIKKDKYIIIANDETTETYTYNNKTIIQKKSIFATCELDFSDVKIKQKNIEDYYEVN